MSTTLFVALQCFECSTMQVKQKKKSSNKWVCVICNQKQSVRKVFAQGYKAKELRFFVQSFNMSRKVVDEAEQAVADTFSEVDVEGEIDEEIPIVREKKRSDWSEYLHCDSPNDSQRLAREEDGEEGNDVKIVTEMPNEMFKRPKLNKYCNAGVSSSSVRGVGKKEVFKPSFSRRSLKTPDFPSECAAEGVTTRTRERSLESKTVTKPASKWDAYLIDDEGEHQAPPRFGRRGVLKDDDVGEWGRANVETSLEYQIVDDEVHPDFM